MSDGAPDFSFSGIKTAVSLYVRRAGPLVRGAGGRRRRVLPGHRGQDAGAQDRAGRAPRSACGALVLTGGVAANARCARRSRPRPPSAASALHVPSRRLCTDNAAMIAAAGHDRLAAGRARPADPERRPRSGAGVTGARRISTTRPLLAGLPDAVIGVDEALRVVLWNPAAEALLGALGPARRSGALLKEVFPADTSLVRHLTETLATGESRSEAEALIESGDGRPVHVSMVTAPLVGRSGRVEAAVAVLRDISRLRQLEAEVRRGETLAAAGRMAVGPRPRDPQSARRHPRRGAAPGARAGRRSARSREYTDVLLKEVDRVNRIIEMLLDLGRPVHAPAGAAQPAPAPRARRAPVRGDGARERGGARSCGATIRACRRSSADEDRCCRCSTTSCATRSRR